MDIFKRELIQFHWEKYAKMSKLIIGTQ